MDATNRPLYIPPQMGLYAEKHRLFEMMQLQESSYLALQPLGKLLSVGFWKEFLTAENSPGPYKYRVSFLDML
ncbi:putative Adenylate kinase 8 protein, partial [Naja naja]